MFIDIILNFWAYESIDTIINRDNTQKHLLNLLDILDCISEN